MIDSFSATGAIVDDYNAPLGIESVRTTSMSLLGVRLCAIRNSAHQKQGCRQKAAVGVRFRSPLRTSCMRQTTVSPMRRRMRHQDVIPETGWNAVSTSTEVETTQQYGARHTMPDQEASPHEGV